MGAIPVAKAQAARQNVIIKQAMLARDGINVIHTYIDTQLPFCYVHLITFVVNIQNLTLAAKCGAEFAVAYAKGEHQVLMNQVIIIILVGALCQGLLSISYFVQDPFGTSLVCLPIHSYIRY